MRKTIRLPCRSRNECVNVLNEIISGNVIKGHFVKYYIQGRNLVIEIEGTPSAIERALMELRKLRYKEKQGVPPSSCLDINMVIKDLGKPFIPDALKVILEIKGFKVSLENNILRTNASKDVVYSISERLAKSLEELVAVKPKASSSAKKLITALSVLLNTDPLTLIEILKNKGCVVEKGHRLLVTKQWIDILKEILESSAPK